MQFLEKISDFIIKTVSPLATVIETNKTIRILKNATSSLLFVLLLGSLWGFVVASLDFLPHSNQLSMFYLENKELFHLPLEMTFGLIGLYITILVSYHASKEWKIETWKTIIASIIVFVLVIYQSGSSMLEYAGAQSFFVGYMVAYFVSKTLVLFKNSTFTLRKITGVPASIADTYDTCIPMFFWFVGIIVIQLLLSIVFTTSIISLVIEFLTILNPLWNNLLFACLFGTLMMMFWYAGLNGYSIIYIFVMPLLVFNLALNLEFWLLGEKVVNVLTPNFFEYFMGATGSGITGAVVVLAMLSKKKTLKSLGDMNVRSAIFTISEPIVFGIPLARNPYFLIPFILGTPIITIVAWKVMEMGLVNMPIFHVAGTPVILAHFLTTFDIRAVLLFCFIILIAICIYFPFFRWYEASIVEQEQSEEVKTILDALDLDF